MNIGGRSVGTSSSTQAGIVRQKNVDSNDILAEVDSNASVGVGARGAVGIVGGGLRSVSTSATLTNVNPMSGVGSKSMPAVTAQPASLNNRSNSGGSSSVNARLNMMTTSSRRSQLPAEPRSRREEFEIYYQKCLKGLRKQHS